MIQQMAVEHRHALDDWVGEIQHDVDRAVKWNIHGIQPCWMRKRRTVFSVSQKVHLVNVEGMQLGRLVDNPPALIGTHADAGHWISIGRELMVIDVEAVLVLGEGDNEVRCETLQRLDVDRLVDWRTNVDGLAGFGGKIVGVSDFQSVPGRARITGASVPPPKAKMS